MNLSIRMRISIAAGVVVAAGLVGCQATRDYVDHLPAFPPSSIPSLDSMVPFRKLKTQTHAEPHQPPKLEPVLQPPEAETCAGCAGIVDPSGSGIDKFTVERDLPTGFCSAGAAAI